MKYPAQVVFALFSDMTNFTKNLPADVLNGSDVVTTEDTLVAKVHGFEIGMKIAEKVPYTLLKYDQYGKSPINYTFLVHLDSKGESETEFMLEMETELSGMFKMMVGGKLQDLVDKVTDQIEAALGRGV